MPFNTYFLEHHIQKQLGFMTKMTDLAAAKYLRILGRIIFSDDARHDSPRSCRAALSKKC